MADTGTPRPPFGATVDGVLALVPTARLLDDTAPAGSLPPGTGAAGVRITQVEAWLDQLSAQVAMRLDGWQALTTLVVPPEETSDRDQLVAYARDLAQQGAASYLEAARFPERTGPATSSYADVLWARFKDGLDLLAVWLERRLAAGDPATGEDTALGAPSGAGAFPPALFPDALAF